MKKTLAAAEKRVLDNGFKLTAHRKAILKILARSKKPLKIAEIFLLESKKSNLDRVSTYRIMEIFKKINLVHSVGEAGFLLCSHLLENEDNHLYLLCDQCKKVEEIALPNSVKLTVEKQINFTSQFKSGGSIQVTGFCSSCRD